MSDAVFFRAFGPAADLFRRVCSADFGRWSRLKGSQHAKPMGATGEILWEHRGGNTMVGKQD